MNKAYAVIEHFCQYYIISKVREGFPLSLYSDQIFETFYDLGEPVLDDLEKVVNIDLSDV